jgi:hypothetical protein
LGKYVKNKNTSQKKIERKKQMMDMETVMTNANNIKKVTEAMRIFQGGLMAYYYRWYPLSNEISWGHLTKQDQMAISKTYYIMQMERFKNER